MPHNTNDAPSTTNNTNIPNGDQPISTCSKSSLAPSLSDTISELKKVFKIPLEMDRTATSVAVSSAAAEQSAASIRKSASPSSTSKPSEVLRATLSTFKTDVQQPSEMDSISETGAVASFESLARDTQSAAAQSTASISVTEASDRGFSVKLPGKVVTATVPCAWSFGFSLQHFEFSLSSSANPAKRDISEFDEDFDLPLLKSFCKRKEAKLVTSSPARNGEEDSVDECLDGTSVVDPLIPEQTSDRAILAPDPVTQDDAPAVHYQEAISSPLPAAVSSPERVDHEPPQDASTPASAFSFGTSDLPSPDPSQDLFDLLLAALVLADSTESASRSASVPADVKPFSDPAG